MGAYFILEEHLRVELGHLGVDALADHLALTCVQELAHLCSTGSVCRLLGYGETAHGRRTVNLGGRAHVALETSSAACIEALKSVNCPITISFRPLQLTSASSSSKTTTAAPRRTSE